ncbi:hypothetical protein [Saccharopolyspora rosea]|uniref:Uncharacterized protein n=1 Tax=Saccharopolyspora rosea TaxID=524884 RepID=A0ABW3FI25_9PSEU|nr:hypothetical protein [Saccharopolyspora rosea]
MRQHLHAAIGVSPLANRRTFRVAALRDRWRGVPLPGCDGAYTPR